MKVLKIIGGIIVGLVILVVLGLYIFIKTVDVNRLKDQVTREISARIGRTVSVHKVQFNFSLNQGLFVDVQGVEVSEDPAFGAEPFVRLGQLKLQADVMAFLKKRTISVSRIEIVSPEIRVIADEKGEMNATRLQAAAQAGSPQPAAAPSAKPQTPAAAPMPEFSIKEILLVNGRVVYENRSPAAPMQITVKDMNGKVTGFSLNQPFDLELQCALFSDSRNIQMSGTTQIDPASGGARLSGVKVKTDLALLSLPRLLEALPQIKAAGLKEGMKGGVHIDIQEASVGPKGLEKLNGQGELSGVRVALAAFPVPVENLAVKMTFNEKDIDVPSFSCETYGGKISGKSRITDYLSKQGFTVDVTAEQISLGALVPEVQPGIKVSGQINSHVQASGEGLSDPAQLMNAVTSQGSVVVNEGKLENLNILKVVLDQISLVPGLVQKIESEMPEKYRESMTRNDTLFQRITSAFEVRNGRLEFKETQLVADVLAVDLKGDVDFQQNIHLDAGVRVPSDFSEYIVSKNEEMKGLLDNNGQIFIPLTPYAGPLNALRMYPDLKYLGEKMIKTQGRQELDKLLDKVFDKEEPNPGQPQDGQAAPVEEKSPERQLIDGVLDKIFK